MKNIKYNNRKSVCLYGKISLTAEPIWFFFAVNISAGPVKVMYRIVLKAALRRYSNENIRSKLVV